MAPEVSGREDEPEDQGAQREPSGTYSGCLQLWKTWKTPGFFNSGKIGENLGNFKFTQGIFVSVILFFYQSVSSICCAGHHIYLISKVLGI